MILLNILITVIFIISGFAVGVIMINNEEKKFRK